MADLRISCPHCKQEISCDELWAGHELACPTCQGAFVVPQPEPPAEEKHNPLVPKPPPGAKPRLNLGPAASKQTEHGGPAPQRTIPIRNLAPPPPQKKNVLLTIVKVVVVLGVVGAGAYFGLTYIKGMQDKANAKSRAEEANSDGGQVAHIANLNKVLDATDPGGPGLARLQADAGAPSPRGQMGAADPGSGGPGATNNVQQLPVVPAVWTLDLAGAKIPEGRANGRISGTNFLVETARVDVVGGAHVLRLVEGQLASPDREVLVYLHLKPGEKIGGQILNISSDQKGSGVPQVAKRWKINPRYAPSIKPFYNGYAMKLELGQAADGLLPGKIFLGLPDNERSVVAGIFKATVNEPDPSLQATPYAAPTATPTTSPDRSAMERRYGIGGRR